MKAYLNDITYYLPEKVLTNSDLSSEFPDWSIQKIAGKIGIDERHLVEGDECASDLGVKAAELLFVQSSVKKTEIDFLLFCTQSPDYFLPTTACLMQDRLGLSKEIGALDFNLGCSGFIYGLSLAKGLIVAGIAKNILLICGETYSKHINKGDRGNRTIFGDAASACFISNRKSTKGAEILDFVLGTDGSGGKNLIVKEGGMRFPVRADIDVVNENDDQRNHRNLYMNGPEVFNFTLKYIPQLVNQTLVKNNLEMDDVSQFIFHQANKYMLNHLRKKIGISENKFPVRMNFCGNTVSSTIQIVLKEMYDLDEIEDGDLVLLAGFGVGLSWGATVLKY